MKMQLETDLRAARLVWIADKQEDSAFLSLTPVRIMECAMVKLSHYRGYFSLELGNDLLEVM